MQVAEPVLLAGHDEQQLFLYALLASRRENNDPIEMPLFHYAQQKFSDFDLNHYQQTNFVPFDPVSKRTEATIHQGNETYQVLKGAAQVLLDMADLPDNEVVAIGNSIDLLASKGYRTLAVARRRDEKSSVDLIGLIPLIDPPRDDSARVISDMQAYGVQVKMVTGDNMAIAREIGAMLGLADKFMRADQLSGKSNTELIGLTRALASAIYHKLNPEVSAREAGRFADSVIEELESIYDVSLINREFLHTHESAIIEMIEGTDIFAEVVPEDKYMLVESLQKAGHIVGMTGDGVNDAPALKKADCGFAVSNATDAARAAADIILTAPGLTVINHAIEQARITFERMKSYSIFRIAETIRIILFMTLSIVVFNFYPITALMIIILALLNDIPILAIAYDNTKVQKEPVRWNMTEMLTVASTLGVAGVLSSFLLFFILVELKFSNEMIQSLMFAKLVVAGHGTIYNTRIDDWFWKKPYPSWVLVSATFSTRVFGTVIAVYGFFIPAIGWTYGLYMWGYALAWFVLNDIIKMITYRVLRSRGLYV
jgi:H+-transporting ATPase